MKGIKQIIISPLCKDVSDTAVAELKAALPKAEIHR
jgi:hypothetical protein